MLRRATFPVRDAFSARDALSLWRIGVMDNDASFVLRTA